MPWFLLPLTTVWDLLAFVLNLTGRLIAGILGAAFTIVGLALTISIDAAPIGIPFAVLGFLLMILSIFLETETINREVVSTHYKTV